MLGAPVRRTHILGGEDAPDEHLEWLETKGFPQTLERGVGRAVVDDDDLVLRVVERSSDSRAPRRRRACPPRPRCPRERIRVHEHGEQGRDGLRPDAAQGVLRSRAHPPLLVREKHAEARSRRGTEHGPAARAAGTRTSHSRSSRSVRSAPPTRSAGRPSSASATAAADSCSLGERAVAPRCPRAAPPKPPTGLSGRAGPGRRGRPPTARPRS